jgi:hypothetical protein
VFGTYEVGMVAGRRKYANRMVIFDADQHVNRLQMLAARTVP